MKKFVELYTLRVNEQFEENQQKVAEKLKSLNRSAEEHSGLSEEVQALE